MCSFVSEKLKIQEVKNKRTPRIMELRMPQARKNCPAYNVLLGYRL
jgi:hypothetical protein